MTNSDKTVSIEVLEMERRKWREKLGIAEAKLAKYETNELQNKINLSEEQTYAAQMSGMTPEEYLKWM